MFQLQFFRAAQRHFQAVSSHGDVVAAERSAPVYLMTPSA